MNDTPVAPVTLRIDFVSDVVCPWCAIGLASLEQALKRLQGEAQVDLHIQPFELNPQMPPEGEEITGHLQRKYGLSAEQVAENQARIHARGAELGFTFNSAGRSRTWNTFDAHRLLHWAGLEGRQVALKHALLRAYFSDDRNISDHATLVALAGSVGLDTGRAEAILASDDFAPEVRLAEQFFQRNGIRSVPAIVIERQHLVSGGQPPDVFEQALRQVAASKAGAGPA